VVEVTVTKVGIERAFPVVSRMDGERRLWTNDMVGHKLIVDKCTLEDATTFQGYEFKVNKGMYCNQGFNTNIGATIEGLFQERLKAKKAKNEGQQKTLKLMLNSGYVKCALKRNTEDIVYAKPSEWEVWISRHYEQTLGYNLTYKGDYRVRKRVPIDNHFNRVQCAGMITAYSKRTMNRVMATAEDNGIDIYYTDTDSMHLLDEDVPKLEAAYEAKYGKVVTGKQLGQFHVDFDLAGCQGRAQHRLHRRGQEMLRRQAGGHRRRDGRAAVRLAHPVQGCG
jgi:hypothetical protein